MTCTFTVAHTGQSGTFTNVVGVAATDDDGADVGGDSNSVTVTITDVPAVPLAIVKSVTSASSLPEPGGDFDFQVVLTNNSTIDVATVTDLDDTYLADLQTSGSCADADGDTSAPFDLSPGESMTCTFTVAHSGDPADFTNIVTVAATDDDGADVGGDSNSVTVSITNVPPTASLNKTVLSMVVTYELTVTNDSTVDDVTLDSLVDDQFGDLLDPANPDIVGTTCASTTIAVGGSYSCTFDGVVSTSPHTNVVTGTVSDAENTSYSTSDGATVSFD
ncbi:MAG: hypothetical protein JRI55_08700 [Deltaproteobacteria bacterium]|jgi:hypothetical protein|nr:hypothetical protein [Deltaproteobacteria bacterium]